MIMFFSGLLIGLVVGMMSWIFAAAYLESRRERAEGRPWHAEMSDHFV